MLRLVDRLAVRTSAARMSRADAPAADKDGAGERTRTSDPRITNALLYQLSYPGGGAKYTA